MTETVVVTSPPDVIEVSEPVTTVVQVGYAQPSGGGGIPGVTVTGTPSSGQVLTATSSSAAHWQAPGASSGFTQAFTSQSVVTVTHNLGRFPAVSVIDTADDVCVGDVLHLSVNAVRLTFSAPFSGTAICT